MIVSVHQPEHFPYLGFFQKMAASDLFVILDDVKFQGRRSFQNRNKFLNRSGNEEWFTVPVEKNSYNKKINEVKTAPDHGWRKQIHNKMIQNLGQTFDHVYNTDSLYEINMRSIQVCREAFDITVPMLNSSELKCGDHKAALLANICKKVGATTYLSGLGAKKYLDKEAIELFGEIKVDFFQPELPDYFSSITHLTNKNWNGENSEL